MANYKLLNTQAVPTAICVLALSAGGASASASAGAYNQGSYRSKEIRQQASAAAVVIRQAPAYVGDAEQGSAINAEFNYLADKWQGETMFTSSLSEQVSHPAYLRIIGLGRAAVPHILARMADSPDMWFSALTAITGEDPVVEADWGNMERMVAAWLHWARSNGYSPASS